MTTLNDAASTLEIAWPGQRADGLGEEISLQAANGEHWRAKLNFSITLEAHEATPDLLLKLDFRVEDKAQYRAFLEDQLTRTRRKFVSTDELSQQVQQTVARLRLLSPAMGESAWHAFRRQLTTECTGKAGLVVTDSLAFHRRTLRYQELSTDEVNKMITVVRRHIEVLIKRLYTLSGYRETPSCMRALATIERRVRGLNVRKPEAFSELDQTRLRLNKVAALLEYPQEATKPPIDPQRLNLVKALLETDAGIYAS